MNTATALNYKRKEEQPTETYRSAPQKTAQAAAYHKQYHGNMNNYVNRGYHEVIKPGRGEYVHVNKRAEMEAAAKICKGCGTGVDESRPFIVEKEGYHYHSECFRCVLCNDVIRDAQYKPGEHGPVCLQCGLPQCAACMNLIVGDLIVANHIDGTPYTFHTQCLKCVDCGCHIWDSYKASANGFKCNVCGNPSCSSCRQIIPGGTQYFLNPNSGAPECGNCYNRGSLPSPQMIGSPSRMVRDPYRRDQMGPQFAQDELGPHYPTRQTLSNRGRERPVLGLAHMKEPKLVLGGGHSLGGHLQGGGHMLSPGHLQEGFIMGPPPSYPGGPQKVYRQ